MVHCQDRKQPALSKGLPKEEVTRAECVSSVDRWFDDIASFSTAISRARSSKFACTTCAQHVDLARAICEREFEGAVLTFTGGGR
ncbi:hypothetical protein A3I41_01770 [Candidatus Uhrbacteria bacterium RIFCSPLOWO2_02_FULL_48_18]|uniref:Uncharacterized protein n=1 Tax=Candidatus Uhrbacteria bacterium RIFCSPLOWO2_02_FULL_48_18 TaxID=1802408 RepID=A0A1F7V6V7_9BACT|nr:MAG: hypothetical protein A3B20_03285 [Candidatus Uhrbacteria bacterium RIFCSPLOWO2_01_FULL_47_17]OGL86272.1 MAG: hypothetical protein A3I41_01770 [Candidatus Uhrbacteria bacterium RIFCSPLOWO2_02_FULL_48_18]